MMQNYLKYAYLSQDEKARLTEIDLKILELQREKAKILKNKALLFEEERDYLAKFIPDFYVNGTSSRHRKVRMNPKYSALWAGIRQSSVRKVFHKDKCPLEATDDQIQEVKKAMTNEIDWLNENIIQKGLLWF